MQNMQKISPTKKPVTDKKLLQAFHDYEFTHKSVDKISKEAGLSREGLYYKMREYQYAYRRQDA